MEAPNTELMCIVWPCTDSQLHVNLHTEFQVFLQVMRMFYLFRNARINILSALVFLSLAGWRLFLDGRSVFFWLSELSFWSAEMRLCWLNCFCTLASRVFFYVLSLSLSFFVSVSVSVFYINALSAWTLTSNWRAINTFYKTWFLEFGNLAQLSNHVIITTTLMVWQH